MTSNKESHSSKVFKEVKKSVNCQTIVCQEAHPIKDFIMDPSGYYVLIRVNFQNARIEVGICNPSHEIINIFEGRSSQDICHAIFEYEKNNNCHWFTEKTHMTYLGKELKKAEVALVLGNADYFQE